MDWSISEDETPTSLWFDGHISKHINKDYEDDDALSEAFAELYEATILNQTYQKIHS